MIQRPHVFTVASIIFSCIFFIGCSTPPEHSETPADETAAASTSGALSPEEAAEMAAALGVEEAEVEGTTRAIREASSIVTPWQHGERLEVTGLPDGVQVFEGCEGSLLIELDGGPEASRAALGALASRSSEAAFDTIPRLNAAGYGVCCRSDDRVPAETCVSLGGLPSSLTPGEVAAYVHQVFGDEPMKLRVVVEGLHESPQARCSAEDEACGPVFYGSPPPELDQAAERRLVSEEVPELSELSIGQCTHDGECIMTGCGNHCASITEEGMAGNCLRYSRLETAACGCVQGQCAWFEQ